MYRCCFRQPIFIPALILFMAPVIASAQGTIEGSAIFWGDAGGGTQIEIAAMTEPWTEPAAATLIGLNASFSLPVPDGTYYIQAYMDRDGGFGDPEPEDVVVLWDADADGRWDTVTVSGGSVTGVDIDLGFVYVDLDATGANNGSTWSDAFTDLQDGIDAAASGIEVWVAEGTYTPGTSVTSSFYTKSGVRVFGGFASGETVRQERDWNAHPTILSCEIGGASAEDNCYHVVIAEGSNPTAMLNGVTVTRGYAGPGSVQQGGGVRARGGGVTLANTIVVDNYAASAGGGVAALLSGAVKAYNSSFVDNQAPGFHGGGFYGSIGTAPDDPQTLVNCVFTGNTAWRGGGIALENDGTLPVLVNISLSGNSAGDIGGGVFTNSNQSLAIQSSILWDNTGTNPQIGFWATQPTVNHSIVHGGWGLGTHIVNDDPSFADAELRINLDSPAIDAGDNTAVPIDVHDADGNHWTDEPIKRDRDFNSRFRNLPYVPNTGVSAPDERPIDMGAYEAWDPTLIFEHDFESNDLDPWSDVVGGI